MSSLSTLKTFGGFRKEGSQGEKKAPTKTRSAFVREQGAGFIPEATEDAVG